jgi:transcriptional regulator with XRE-family HTH domain
MGVRGGARPANRARMTGRQTPRVNDLLFGAAIRAARLRRGWSQADLAGAIRVSRGTVSRIERGRLDELSFGTLRRVARALDVSLELLPKSRSGDLDRVRSARHSALAEAVIGWIGGLPGWTVVPEVSFSIYADRGVVDLVAWHAATRSLLVIELKTAIVDVGELLGTLHRKVRLAAKIVADLGWVPASISAALIVGDSMTNRRRVTEHAATFRSALPDDGRRLKAWLADPAGVARALRFVSDARPRSVRSGFSTPRRIGRPRRPSGPLIVNAPPHESASRAPSPVGAGRHRLVLAPRGDPTNRWRA